MARPRKPVDVVKLELMAEMGLTQKECAALLECSVDTIQRNYQTEYEEGVERCKGSLRRKQYELATAGKGNVTMLIWLGKNLLGQSDKLEATGKDGAPLFAPVNRDELILKLRGGPRSSEPVEPRADEAGSTIQ